MFRKDKNILMNWIKEAERNAINRGFRRMLDKEAMLRYYMLEEAAFNTTDEEKKQMLPYIEKRIMDFEKICQLIEKEGLYESSARMIGDCLIW